MSDIVLCSLRYTMEQTYSFLTNTTYLQDTVPFQNLRHIEHCFDYVHGLKFFNEGVKYIVKIQGSADCPSTVPWLLSYIFI